ncbi:MAG TPA: glycerol-3-phosphate acyltransferase [Anaerolineales bacterium]|nr:glycerol-3-phosphate acyltransferase [Anaerolineales bacterium]
MEIILTVVGTALGYFCGSIPFGLIIVRLKTGQDVRQFGSGRTGGTNVARAAGFWAGLVTAALDIFKVTFAVWLASWVAGGNGWAEALGGVAGILGHNNSIFLLQRVTTEAGRTRLQFQGGAGGASAIGGAIGLWPLSVAFILPAGLFFLFVIGYASVATMAVGLAAIVVFAVRAMYYGGPWAHVAFGALTLLLQVWALRPNIERLMNGSERVFNKSLRGWWLARRTGEMSKQSK